MSNLRASLLWGAAAALVVIVAIGLSRRARPMGQASPRSAESAPTPGSRVRRRRWRRFTGRPTELLPGARAALLARVHALRSYPVVINVWAVWCGPCRVELPMLQKASLEWGRRVAFLGVDLQDDRSSAESLLREIPMLVALGRLRAGEMQRRCVERSSWRRFVAFPLSFPRRLRRWPAAG